MSQIPKVNWLCQISSLSDYEIFEDRIGGIVVTDKKGQTQRFTSRRKCIRFLQGSTKKVLRYALESIKDDLAALGDTKGLTYE